MTPQVSALAEIETSVVLVNPPLDKA